MRTDGAQPDAGGRDSTVAAEHDVDGGGDAGEVADLALELEVCPSRPSRADRDPDLGHHLVGVQAGRERPLEEAGRRQHALTACRPDHELGADREHHRAPVAGGIGVADRAADCPHVADERIGDERRRVEEHVERAAQVGGALDIAMTGARSDTHMPVFSANSLESINSSDIDDDDWSRKSQFQ